jgi:transposase
MRKIREILRLYHEIGLSRRQIAESLQIAHSTVDDVLRRTEGAGLGWPIPDNMTWDDVEQSLYPGNTGKPRARPMPEWEQVHRELKGKKSVTLQLLWYEYKQANPDGIQYSQFCAHYREWVRKLDVVMRQTHRAGEKMFVDFAGETVPIVDPASGEIEHAYVYVAVLGASNYTYAEATMSQDLESWVALTRNALEFFGGSTEIWVPDNLKAGVSKACRYEPDINPTYSEMAEYYGAVVIPVRPRKPRAREAKTNGYDPRTAANVKALVRRGFRIARTRVIIATSICRRNGAWSGCASRASSSKNMSRKTNPAMAYIPHSAQNLLFDGAMSCTALGRRIRQCLLFAPALLGAGACWAGFLWDAAFQAIAATATAMPTTRVISSNWVPMISRTCSPCLKTSAASRKKRAPLPMVEATRKGTRRT